MRISAAQFSPKILARVGGILYLIIIAAGLFTAVDESLIVPADAAATAANIETHQFLFRLGLAADLSTFVCAAALTLILYVLLKPVDRNVALLMVMFNLVQDAIGGINALSTFRPLQLLGGADYLKAFTPEQLKAMALLSLKTHEFGFGIALIFFGFSCLALGYLVFMAGFFPKPLGLLIAVAGLCYLTNSLALIVFPRLASTLFPAILVPAFIGELSLALWLTVKGVDVLKWENKARAGGDCNA